MTKHIKPTRIDADQFTPYVDAGVTLIPLRPWNSHNDNGDPTGKLPLKGWRTNPYSPAKVIANSIKANRNVGWRIDDGWIALDFDPRNAFGDDELAALLTKYQIDPATLPTMDSGGAGVHVYFRVAEGMRFRNTVPGFGAVEVKGVGRFVVAAGSIHPNGTMYRWRDGRPPLCDAPEAPQALLKVIKRPEPAANFAADSARIEPEQLATMLAVLPVEDFNTNDAWEPILMAAHHATGGAGLAEFIEWSTQDPAYGDQAAIIEARWNSLDSDKSGGRTIGTLNKALTDAGHPELVARITAAEEFDEAVDDKWLKGEPEEATPPPRKKIIFSPFVLGDPTLLPPRDWIYKPIYLRKFLSLTTALGGTGKSSLIMTEAVAMASGKALLGIEPVKRLRVFYWNGEDPEDEIDRHLHAICQHYELSKPDVERYLFRDSGRVLPIKIARTKNGTTQIAVPIVDELQYALKDQNIDAMIIDPFVASHAATENDNNAMEIVAKKWSHIADAGDLSIHVVHHNRKPAGGAVGTIDDARGGTALINAARVRRAFNKMTDAQAKAAGIDPARRGFYISADLANTNVAKPAAALNWYELNSVDLGNGTIEQDADEIGVPVVFEYAALEAVEATPEQTEAVLKALRERDDWRGNQQSQDWIGHAIGTAMGLILDGDTHKAERAQVKKMIADWLKDGTLIEYEGLDTSRKKRAFLKVNDQSPPNQQGDHDFG